jgi:hypothetical protein
MSPNGLKLQSAAETRCTVYLILYIFTARRPTAICLQRYTTIFTFYNIDPLSHPEYKKKTIDQSQYDVTGKT